MSATAAIDAVLEKAVAAGDVPGVVALAADDRGVVYQGAHGRRVLGGEAAMTPDSVFWIASMTKAVTSVAAMQLVEGGLLTLDAPIAPVLPELAERPVLEGFDAEGRPRLRPAKRPVTLRHLLTHTAGFAYDMWNADIKRLMERENVPGVISCRQAALQTPLTFDPGEKWHYGINIDFVGRAVEAVSGRSLQDYFRAHILDPLGMADTGFTLGPGQRARRVGSGCMRVSPMAVSRRSISRCRSSRNFSWAAAGSTAPASIISASSACCSPAAASMARGS